MLTDVIELIYDGDKNNPIISLKYDDQNEMLWFGTPNSDFQCLSLRGKSSLNSKGEN